MSKICALCLILASLAITCAMFGQAGGSDNRQAVIIGFRQQPGQGEAAFVRAMGGTVRHTYRIIPAIAARLPQPAIEALRNNPAVTGIDPDLPVYASSDVEYASAWGVPKVGAKLVHTAGNTGGGVKVCVIDSGIDLEHRDLPVSGGYDFVHDDTSPEDENGHGTHTAGTVAALLNGTGVVGVAPEASLLIYKILGADGRGSFSDAIAAVEACAAADGKVSNNSYGSSGDPGGLVKAAFDNAYNNKGVLHVASAGNTGSGADTVGYPAKYDSVIAVAATDANNNRASFSSTGPDVELAAPGVSVYSTYLNNSYAYMSGTSMASPHVAGVAALVFNCGYATNALVRARLQATAQDLGTAGRDASFGFGLVRADLACNLASPPPAAPGNLTAALDGRAVRLNWTDVSGETEFVIERCKAGKNSCNFAALATAPANATSYTDTSAARRTTYSYRLKARNSGGDSGYSNTATIKTN